MPLEVIYVVRHGFRTAWTVDPTTGVYSSTVRSPTGIAADPPLTAHGTDQAAEMARHLMTLDPPIDAVYSSPYYRCLQTITPFVDLRQRQQADGAGSGSRPDSDDATRILPEKGISEYFGAAPFDHPVPASPEVLKSMFPAYCMDYVSAQTPSRKGETLAQLYERIATTLRAIVDRCDAEGRRAIVLCTHAAVVIALGRILTGDVPEDPEVEDFQAFTCGLSTYRRREGRANVESGPAPTSTPVLGDWSCEVNSDCSFLSHGAERGWRFSGDESFPGTGSMSQTDEPKL